jgi:hypothetical protein
MAVCSVEKDLTLAKPPRLLLLPLEPLQQCSSSSSSSSSNYDSAVLARWCSCPADDDARHECIQQLHRVTRIQCSRTAVQICLLLDSRTLTIAHALG